GPPLWKACFWDQQDFYHNLGSPPHPEIICVRSALSIDSPAPPGVRAHSFDNLSSSLSLARDEAPLGQKEDLCGLTKSCSSFLRRFRRKRRRTSSPSSRKWASPPGRSSRTKTRGAAAV